MIRLYVEAFFKEKDTFSLSSQQVHYLFHVMRKKQGDLIHVFNGTQGEWKAVIQTINKKSCTLGFIESYRLQVLEEDIWLMFSPIKSRFQDFMIEKAVELGVSSLYPALTKRSVIRNINDDKLKAQIIEASEQCGRLSIPEIKSLKKLEDILSTWPLDRLLIFGDESGDSPSWNAISNSLNTYKNYAFLVGPEGGFTSDELNLLKIRTHVQGVSLGPLILRAETAALVGLTLIRQKFL